MSDRVQLPLQVSPEFKDAIGVYAQSNNMSMSELIRVAVAQYINYDIASDPIVNGRPKKYANAEERLKAQREKAKKSRESVKSLVEEYFHDEHIKGIQSLEEWLARRAEQQENK